MPHYFKVKRGKKSHQPGPSHKCRNPRHCNTSGKPNKFTPGWILNKDGELIYVGVDQDGNDKVDATTQTMK